MNKLLKTLLIILGVTGLLVAEYFFIIKFLCPTQNPTPLDNNIEIDEPQTEAFMLMIEFEDTSGLVNFVDDLKERDIPGLLLVSAEFVDENCEVIKNILDYHNVEIAATDSSRPYWDVPYEEQNENMKRVKDTIYQCTGRNIRVFGSKYFAYDENTVKAAQENGIGYVLARGTTGAKATIYQPEEYDVKIFSVSNVESHHWGTGSLCDYSYWAREGIPLDFEKELFKALQYEKISPVSHTYIGGLKKSWNDVYIKFFDESDIRWVDLERFGNVDQYLPFSEIPVNREVQYDTPHPAIPLDEEENLSNPCSVEDISESLGYRNNESNLVVFHNNTGAMCLEFLDFLKEQNIKYEEHLNTDSDYQTTLNSYRKNITKSEGVSESYGYYPIIFIADRAFSGFNEGIGKEILKLL